MEDTRFKKESKGKRCNSIKNYQNKSKLFLPVNVLITNKISSKQLLKTVNDGKQIRSRFCNKLEFLKNKDFEDLNKSVKVDNYKKYFSLSSDKKLIHNSVSQDFITKILEINNTESSLKKNSSNALFFQKEEGFSNSINSIKPKIKESKEESKISIKKNENIKIQETIPRIKNKNTNQNISKNKNSTNVLYKSGTVDFRKHSKKNLDSSYSFFANQSENEDKYNSSISSNLRSHLKKADILFGLHQINENGSS